MKKEWVIVADGAKAKILQRNGRSLDHVFPTYHKNEIINDFDQDAKKPGHIKKGSKFLGTIFDPDIPLHELEKLEFIQFIAKILNHNVNKFDRLTVIAPAERLGELRVSLSSAVTSKVVKEINKDLTKKPLEEVYEYMVALPD